MNLNHIVEQIRNSLKRGYPVNRKPSFQIMTIYFLIKQYNPSIKIATTNIKHILKNLSKTE